MKEIVTCTLEFLNDVLNIPKGKQLVDLKVVNNTILMTLESNDGSDSIKQSTATINIIRKDGVSIFDLISWKGL